MEVVAVIRYIVEIDTDDSRHADAWMTTAMHQLRGRPPAGVTWRRDDWAQDARENVDDLIPKIAATDWAVLPPFEDCPDVEPIRHEAIQVTVTFPDPAPDTEEGDD